MLTAEQKLQRRDAEKRYAAAVRKAISDWQTQETAALQAIRDDILRYQNDILAGLADDTPWDAHRIEQVTKMLEDAKAQLAARLSGDFDKAATERTALALDMLDKPLEAFGVNVGAIGRQLPVAQLNYLRTVAPTLITNVTSETHESVRNILVRHAHGGLTKAEAIQQIGKAVGPLRTAELKPGQVIPRAEVRARMIFRNEINKMASITQAARMDQLSKADDGIGKRWVHWPSHQPRPSHEALHGTVVFPGHGEKFKLAGLEIDGPHDPALPASEDVNCYCHVVATYDPERSTRDNDPVLAAAPAAAGAPAPTPAPPTPPKRPAPTRRR